MSYKYCPQCTRELIPRHVDGLTRLTCPNEACDFTLWDNPVPVVAGLVEYGDSVILIQNQGWPAYWWGLVTGFLEREETPEQGMLRELKEELGLKGEIVGYIGTYTFFERNQLILAYHLKAEGEIIKGDELAGYKLVPTDQLQPWPKATGDAVRDWLAARQGGAAPGKGRLIDLSQVIEPDMPLFSPQAPAPVISAYQSHAQAAASGRYEDCSCEITRVDMLTSIGTYLDSPAHFHPGAESIADIGIERVVLPGLKVDCTQAEAGRPLGPELLDGLDIGGKAVLLETGWSRYWGEPRYMEFPFISKGLARALVEGGAKLAGMDFLMADNPGDPRRPAHMTLLGAGVLILENLTHLESLPALGFTLHAAPVKLAGAAAFPVRAYGRLDAR